MNNSTPAWTMTPMAAKDPEPTRQIFIQPTVAQRLNREANRGAILPKRGRAEIGGILLGTLRSDGGARSLLIQDLEAFDCVYATGPNWTLSANEQARLTLLGDARTSGEQRPVGMYRTHTRVKPGLSAEDLDLYQACFPGPEDVCILLYLQPAGPAYAEIWHRQEGRISQFSAESLEHAVPASGDSESQCASGAIDLLPEPVQHPPVRSQMLVTALVVSTLLAVGSTALAVFAFHRTTSQNGSSFGLQLKRHSDHVLLMWDQKAVSVQLARRGRLTILQSGYERNVPLSTNDLRSGRLFYLEDGNNVEFKLDLEQKDGRWVGESVNLNADADERSMTHRNVAPQETIAGPTAFTPVQSGRSAEITPPTRVPANQKTQE